MPRARGLSDRILDGLISRFEGVVGRVLRRVARSLARLLAGRGSFTEADINGLLEPLRVQWEQHVNREVLPAVSTVYRRASTALAEQFAGYGHQLSDLSPLTAEEYLANTRNRLVAVSDTIWESVRVQLVEGVQAGDSIDELAARVRAASGFGEGRARTIARTEVISANNAASLATALLADDGSMRKEWLATPDVDGTGCDERTRAAHCAADGQTRPLTEPFDVGGSPLMFPGDPAGPADQVINCRCTPGYVFGEDEPAVASMSDFHRPGGRDHNQQAHAGTNTPAGDTLGHDGDLFTWEQVEGLYGEQVDEREFDDGLSASVHRSGALIIYQVETPDRHKVAADFGDGDSARRFADLVEQTTDTARNVDDDAEPGSNGLVDWVITDGGLLVGYDPAGDVRVRQVDPASYDGENLDDIDGFDVGVDTADRLVDALREMADIVDEIDDEADPVTAAGNDSDGGDFHLPGKHDQKAHGRKRVNPTGAPTATTKRAARKPEDPVTAATVTQSRDRIAGADRKRLPVGTNPREDIPAAGSLDRAARSRVAKAMRAAYRYRDKATGLTVRIDEAGVAPGGRSATATFTIVNRDGVKKGSGQRFWHVTDDGRLMVSHSELMLDPNVQGGGFAARFNAQAEDVYRDAGVGEIQLHADMDVGGYAWAVAGYDFRDEQDVIDVGRQLNNWIAANPVDDQTREQVRALVARATPEHFAAGTHPTPYEYAMVGRHAAVVQQRPGGREILVWPGKQALLRSDWRGRKRLTAPVVAADAAGTLLDEVAALSLAYADTVADTVPAHPEDVDLIAGSPSEYPTNHHLFSAPPDAARVLLDLADGLLADAAVGGEPAMTEERGLVVVAAVQVHTGAMVALVPSEADSARLAVEGGEDPDQLHVTLAYLGDAADIPDEARQRIVEAMRRVADGLPVGEADGFAVSVFNPGDATDRDTCVVLGLSGDGLEDIHGAVEEALTNLQTDGGFTLPEQHTPWIPHLTLTYTDDLSVVEQVADRVGPVAFDRVRVAFAGENVDIPFGASDMRPDSSDDLDVDWDSYFARAIEEFVQSDAKLREHWVHGEGAAKIRWGTGGDFDRCVRQLRKYVRDPEGLCAEYHKEATGVWPGAKKGHASESEDAMAADTMPPPEAVPEVVEDDCPEGHHRMPDGECMPDTAIAVDATAQPGEHFHTRVMEGVSTGMRQFAPGAITWREVPFAYHWQYKSSAHSGVPETVQVGLVTRAEREGDTVHFYGRLDLRSPEGLDYARRLAEGFARWSSVGADESLKDRHIDVEYVIPADAADTPEAGEGVAEVDEMTFRAYRVAEVTSVSVPALADATVEPTQELVDALAEMGVIAPPAGQVTDETAEEEPELVPVAAASGPIVAGAYTVTIPDLPPAAWFDEPETASPHGELRVEESGRIYGYLAPKGIAHRSFRNRRVEVPMGRVDYGGWQNKPWPVAEGHKVYVGVITMDCGHASTNPADWSYEHRREHYDNSCSVAAHARIGENRHGVWVAGALAPWIDAEKLGKMMSCQLSGDWAAHNDRPGWQDFIAALFVPVEGFPKRVPAATVRVADGALVASAVPVRFVHDGHSADLSLRPVLERIARGIGRDSRSRLDALHARVHADR